MWCLKLVFDKRKFFWRCSGERGKSLNYIPSRSKDFCTVDACFMSMHRPVKLFWFLGTTIVTAPAPPPLHPSPPFSEKLQIAFLSLTPVNLSLGAGVGVGRGWYGGGGKGGGGGLRAEAQAERPERGGPCWLLKRSQMETRGVHLRGPSWLGSFGLSCQYKGFLSCLDCSSRPSTKYFPHCTLFQIYLNTSPFHLCTLFFNEHFDWGSFYSLYPTGIFKWHACRFMLNVHYGYFIWYNLNKYNLQYRTM